MKKTLVSLTAAVMAALAFTSCAAKEDDTTVRIASLQGPTTIGILNLMNDEEASSDYEFTMLTQPDEAAALINAGDVDIALIPANLASVLYNKTNGGISVIDINTMGVLYCITGDETVTSIEDLAGRTVVTTGQGATPEYAVRYLLDQYGITDCELDFRSEGTEVIAALNNDPMQVAILPQPAATAATIQVEGVATAFSLLDAWENVTSDSSFVTGVTVVRNDFLSEHPAAVSAFIEAHQASAEAANTDVEGTAALVVEQGIVGAAPVAQRAIPLCNIVCITGEEMRSDLQGYLQTLFDQNPQAVGGTLPGDDFYYLG